MRSVGHTPPSQPRCCGIVTRAMRQRSPMHAWRPIVPTCCIPSDVLVDVLQPQYNVLFTIGRTVQLHPVSPAAPALFGVRRSAFGVRRSAFFSDFGN